MDFKDLRINFLSSLSDKKMLEEVEAIKDEITDTDIDKSLEKSNVFYSDSKFCQWEHLRRKRTKRQ